MIITTAIALNAVKGLILGQSSPTPPAAAETTTLPENQPQPGGKQKRQKGQKEHKEDKDQDDAYIPYVSVSDCNACPTPCPDQEHLHYPAYLKIDQEMPLLHSMKPYTRHVLISTGQDDWEAHIDDDKTSLAPFLQKAIDEGQQRLKEVIGGKDVPRIVLTNSSRKSEIWDGPGWQVIILPDQIVVNNVTQDQCDDFFEAFLKPAVGTVDHQQGSITSDFAVEKDHGTHGLHHGGNQTSSESSTTTDEQREEGSTSISATRTFTTTTTTTTTTTASSSTSSLSSQSHNQHQHHHSQDQTKQVTAGKTTFLAHKWQPKAAVMICSHRKRDKRCGVTAPILKKEFTRILRSKDIYGDCEGDVEIWLVSHIGGHKFAGNVIVHKSEGMAVWYGRVDPCHAQAIVDVTIEKGEVIKELYRGSMIGSFDQSKKIAW